MSDHLDQDLREVLAKGARVEDAELEPLRARIRALPARGGASRLSLLGRAAAVVLAIGVGAGAIAVWIGAPGGSGAWVPSGPPAAIEGDPATWTGDPRMQACAGTAEQRSVGGAVAVSALEMAQAADYRRHLPAMGRAPELEVDEPAFLVVFQVFDVDPEAPQGSPVPGETTPPPSNPVHAVCVVVGGDLQTGFNYYARVDITGFVVALGPEPTPGVDDTPDVFPYALSCGPLDRVVCHRLAQRIAGHLAVAYPGERIESIAIHDECGTYEALLSGGRGIGADIYCFLPAP
jgi:hypothetical protein